MQDALVAAAAAASRETLPLFRTDLAVDNKVPGGFDPVTVADKAAETAVRAILSERFPTHEIIGEEFGTTNSGSPYSWAIDPIDGTRAFISGVPVWGTLIGMMVEKRAVAGIMQQPFTGETFLGLPGKAIYSRGDQSVTMRTSGRTSLAEARLFTTSPNLFDTLGRQAIWSAIEAGALQTRYGCDCYAYCLVAAGHADLVVEPKLNVYDIAALIPIIEAAGGVVRTWDGGPADLGGDIVAAATPELMDEVLALMRTTRG